MIGSPFTTTPAATASSRAFSAGRPRLLAPSPETSITRRAASNGASASSRMPWSIAPLIEVPPPNRVRGARSIFAAIAAAEAGSDTRVHDTVGTCRPGPVHWNIVTAMAPFGPDPSAWCSRGERNASA